MQTISRKTKGERTAQRILDSAEAVFGVQGYAGATMQDIAGEAGVSLLP